MSADTVLRSVRAEPTLQHAAPRAIGIDDFALRRGHRDGTVIVDLDRRRIIDVLPARDVAAVAQWLRAHLTVRFAARDRAEGYADGAQQVAPHAVQIADRWHLLENAGDALEHVLLRHRVDLKHALAPEEIPPVEDGSALAACPTLERRHIAAVAVLSLRQDTAARPLRSLYRVALQDGRGPPICA